MLVRPCQFFMSESLNWLQTKESAVTAGSCSSANRITSDMRKMSVPDGETLHALMLVNAWESNCFAVNKRVLPLLHNTKEVGN